MSTSRHTQATKNTAIHAQHSLPSESTSTHFHNQPKIETKWDARSTPRHTKKTRRVPSWIRKRHRLHRPRCLRNPSYRLNQQHQHESPPESRTRHQRKTHQIKMRGGRNLSAWHREPREDLLRNRRPTAGETKHQDAATGETKHSRRNGTPRVTGATHLVEMGGSHGNWGGRGNPRNCLRFSISKVVVGFIPSAPPGIMPQKSLNSMPMSRTYR